MRSDYYSHPDTMFGAYGYPSNYDTAEIEAQRVDQAKKDYLEALDAFELYLREKEKQFSDDEAKKTIPYELYCIAKTKILPGIKKDAENANYEKYQTLIQTLQLTKQSIQNPSKTNREMFISFSADIQDKISYPKLKQGLLIFADVLCLIGAIASIPLTIVSPLIFLITFGCFIGGFAFFVGALYTSNKQDHACPATKASCTLFTEKWKELKIENAEPTQSNKITM